MKESPTGGGGQASTSSTGGGGAGGTDTTSTGGGGATSSSTGGPGGGGSGPLGLIVATGTDSGNRVMVTINPATGDVLQSTTLDIVTAAYDEVTDLWYVFEGSAVPPTPGNMTLHVGTIDPATGVFKDKHQLKNIPITVDIQNIAVLNNRIVYKAYDPTSDQGFGAPKGLAIIDTSTMPPTLGGSSGFIQLADFFGLIGTRGNGVDGGTVTLISLETCVGATCELDRTRVSFPSNPSQDPGASAATPSASIPKAPNGASISAAWTSRVKDTPTDIIAFPPVTGSDGTIDGFNPNSSQMLLNKAFDAPASTQFYAAAVAECEDVVVISEQANMTLYAVSLNDSTKIGTVGTSNPAQIMAYEPITKTVVVPLHVAGTPIVGYSLTMSGTTPVLAKRNWNTPTSLNADNVFVRRLKQPTTASCGQ